MGCDCYGSTGYWPITCKSGPHLPTVDHPIDQSASWFLENASLGKPLAAPVSDLLSGDSHCYLSQEPLNLYMLLFIAFITNEL